MRSLLTAVQFLTRVPVPGSARPASSADLRRAAMFFPLVGSSIGVVTAAVVWGASQLWPIGLAAVVGLAVEALLTGALHEDAVADFFDAFGGGRRREDVLRILKDSRIGSYGALALSLALLLRAGAITALEREVLFAALAASAGLGRWVLLIVMALLPPPSGQSSLAREVGRQIGWREIAVGALGAAPGVGALVFVQPFRSALALACVALLVVFFYRYLKRRLGGATGDCLGCLCYLSQIVVLLASAIDVQRF
ncbi:MAG: adenosylcobinamide-GDP ribazoletransferase [Thermoanaerobaculia bacterium]